MKIKTLRQWLKQQVNLNFWPVVYISWFFRKIRLFFLGQENVYTCFSGDKFLSEEYSADLFPIGGETF